MGGVKEVDKAIGWIRKTGNKMDEAEQQVKIEEYCRKNLLELTEVLETEDFRDVAYGSGWTRNRIIKAVVVARAIDVSEDYCEYEAYKLKLRLRNSDLAAADGRKYAGYSLYDTLLDGVFKAFCEMEVRNDPVRNNIRRRKKMAEGGYIGGNAPMGYRVVNGELVINPEEVPVVLCIMDRKHSGKTMMSTVDALNQNGYKTRRGKPFVISTVQSIWNNEQFYRGYTKYGKNGEWVQGQHEPILKY